MRTIWKFPLEVRDDSQVVEMPKGSRVVRVGDDGFGTLCLWAVVETEATKEDRVFHVVATGQEMPLAIGLPLAESSPPVAWMRNRVQEVADAYLGTVERKVAHETLIFHVMQGRAS
jgi:hypothetical protein